jgi:ABC-type Fe3+/spermidine/putrescine transport system ATPase subunit
VTDSLDKEEAELRRQLQALLALKRRLTKKERPRSGKGRGRPRVSSELIEKARILAIDLPLSDVALRIGICKSTMRNYGINRKRSKC